MESKLLAICIPTFDRAQSLQDIITRMIDVCNRNSIDIYISDNASMDNTKDICEALAQKHNFIHYYRQPENIGPDDNFEYVLKMPTSQYRWLMSDTCFVENIDTAVEDLKRERYDAYIANGNIYRAANLPKENRIYHDTKDLMVDVGWHLTWISCMIYNRDLIDQLNFTRYKKSSFNQMAVIYETCANRSSNIKFNCKCIVGNVGTTKQSAWHFHVWDVFYQQLFSMIMSLPIYYTDTEKTTCFRNHTSKAEVLERKEHLQRRLNGYWNAGDILRNKFYIQLSGENYYLLLFMGYCPIRILRKLQAIRVFIRGIKYKLINIFK